MQLIERLFRLILPGVWLLLLLETALLLQLLLLLLLLLLQWSERLLSWKLGTKGGVGQWGWQLAEGRLVWIQIGIEQALLIGLGTCEILRARWNPRALRSKSVLIGDVAHCDGCALR